MNEKMKDHRIELKLFIIVLTIGLLFILHTTYKFSEILTTIPEDTFNLDKQAFMIDLYKHFALILLFFVSALAFLIYYSRKRYIIITREEVTSINRDVEETQTMMIQQEKLASIGQLAAGVAHELNNPIGFVNSNVHALSDYVVELNNYIEALENENDSYKTLRADHKDIEFILDDMPSLVEESLEGLSRVTSIVKSLKDYARIDYDDSHEYDLNKGIEATLIVARNTYKYIADVETSFDDIPLMRANGNHINEVILNLIVNAAQAIESQKRGSKGSIKIKTYLENNKIICEVNDDGPGIEEVNLSKIFDPFFTTKAPGKGTGLGLNIAYNTITQKNDGELLVSSDLGIGTTFIIKLPMVEGDANENIIC